MLQRRTINIQAVQLVAQRCCYSLSGNFRTRIGTLKITLLNCRAKNIIVANGRAKMTLEPKLQLLPQKLKSFPNNFLFCNTLIDMKLCQNPEIELSANPTD